MKEDSSAAGAAPFDQAAEVVVHRRAGGNPMIIVSSDAVLAWLRSVADAKGYSDRATCAVQLRVDGTAVDPGVYLECPELIIMVSNIPNSREQDAEHAGRDGWRPIETAPKGCLVDIWIKNSNGTGTRWADCYRDNICSEWRTSRPGGHLVAVPERVVTHWRYPPSAPEQESASDERDGAVGSDSDRVATPESNRRPASMAREEALREALKPLAKIAFSRLDEDRGWTAVGVDISDIKRASALLSSLKSEGTPPKCDHDYEAEDDKGWRCKRCGHQT